MAEAMATREAPTGGAVRREVTSTIKESLVRSTGVAAQVKPASRGGQSPVAVADRLDRVRTAGELDTVRSELADLQKPVEPVEKERSAMMAEIMVRSETPRETQERIASRERIDNFLAERLKAGKPLEIPEGHTVLFHDGAEGEITPLVVPENYTREDIEQAMKEAGMTGEFRVNSKWLQALDEVSRIMLEGVKDAVNEATQQQGDDNTSENPEGEQQPGTKQLTVTDRSGNRIMVEVHREANQEEIKQEMRAKGIEPDTDVQVTDERGRNVDI